MKTDFKLLCSTFKKSEWFIKMPSLNRTSGYVLIGSACLLIMLSFGYRSSFGLFVKPITEANEWGRDVISLALAIQNLFWGIVAVFTGGLADRFGNAKVIMGGTLAYAFGMMVMSGVANQLILHSSAGLLVGAGIAGTSFGIVLPAMARAAGESRRQAALGLGTAAGSLGQFALVPITQQLINGFGWITSLNILAASALIMAVLAIPLAPYSGKNEAMPPDQDQTLKQALHEALQHRCFLLLVSGFFVCGFHVALITAHMPAFLSDKGFNAELGAWSLSLIGLCNVLIIYFGNLVRQNSEKISPGWYIHRTGHRHLTFPAPSHDGTVSPPFQCCHGFLMAGDRAAYIRIGCRHVWHPLFGPFVWYCLPRTSNRQFQRSLAGRLAL